MIKALIKPLFNSHSQTPLAFRALICKCRPVCTQTETHTPRLAQPKTKITQKREKKMKTHTRTSARRRVDETFMHARCLWRNLNTPLLSGRRGVTERAELFHGQIVDQVRLVFACLSLFEHVRFVFAHRDEAFFRGCWGRAGGGGELKCGAVSGAARRLLPRMVLALLELVAESRFPKQQSLRNKHKH